MGSISALNKVIFQCIFWVVGVIKHEAAFDRQITEIRDQFQIGTNSPSKKTSPLVINDSDINIQHRCGRPFDDLRRETKPNLFVRWLYDIEQPRSKYITSFFIQKAMFQVFFGDSIGPRSGKTIEHDIYNHGHSSCKERYNETESNKEDDFPAEFHKETLNVLEIKDHSIVEYQSSLEQTAGTPIFANLADISPPPNLLDILNLRNEETASQPSLTEMIMMLQKLTALEFYHAQVDRQECDSAAFSDKEVTTANSCVSLKTSIEDSSCVLFEVFESVTYPLESPISPLTLFQLSGNESFLF